MKQRNRENLMFNGDEETPAEETTRGALAMMSGVAPAETMPGGDLDLGVPRRGRILNTGTMLVVILFVVAAGAIYTMRSMQSDLKSSGVAKELELKVEQALARVMDTTLPASDPLNREQMDNLFKDTDSVLNMFSSDPKERQVPPEFVQKNPFVLPVFKSANEPQAEPVKEDNRRELELQREAVKYQVQSIMKGARPVAIINGDLYKAGQKLGSFTIVSIDDLSVTIEAEGFRHRLSMGSEDGAKFKTPFGR